MLCFVAWGLIECEHVLGCYVCIYIYIQYYSVSCIIVIYVVRADSPNLNVTRNRPNLRDRPRTIPVLAPAIKSPGVEARRGRVH